MPTPKFLLWSPNTSVMIFGDGSFRQYWVGQKICMSFSMLQENLNNGTLSESTANYLCKLPAHSIWTSSPVRWGDLIKSVTLNCAISYILALSKELSKNTQAWVPPKIPVWLIWGEVMTWEDLKAPQRSWYAKKVENHYPRLSWYLNRYLNRVFLIFKMERGKRWLWMLF